MNCEICGIPIRKGYKYCCTDCSIQALKKQGKKVVLQELSDGSFKLCLRDIKPKGR